MSDEIVDFKRQQLSMLRSRRIQEAPSVLERFKVEITTPVSQAADAAEKKSGVEKCPHCHGTGMVHGLFSASECYLCDGTGFDLSDPVALIKHLLAGGRKLRIQYNAKVRELKDVIELMGPEEVERKRELRWAKSINSAFD